MKKVKNALLILAMALLMCALMCVCAFADGEVARVESTGQAYTDLNTAIKAAGSNDTVTLLQDFEIPEYSGVYMDAGNKKKYTIKGATPATTLTFGAYGDFWGETDITFENITINISTARFAKESNAYLRIGNTMKVTFGNGCTVTTDSTSAVGTVLQPQDTAVVTMASGSVVKDMSFSIFANVCTSSTFNLDGVKLDNVTVNGTFVTAWDTAAVNVSSLDASGVTMASGATALLQRGGSGVFSFTGKVKTESGTTPVKVLKASASGFTGADTAELKSVTADATLWYNKADVVDVTKDGTTSSYAGIYTAFSNMSKYTEGYVVTLNGDQTIAGKINSQNPVAERYFTLDGNGHRLTMSTDSGTVWGSGKFTFKNVVLAVKNQQFGNGTQVTLDDGCVVTAIDSGASYAIKVINTAKLTMKSGSSVKDASFAECIIEADQGDDSSHPVIVTEAGVTAENVTVTSDITVKANSYSTVSGAFGAKAKSGNTYCLDFLAAVTAAANGTSSYATEIVLYDDIEFNGTVPGAKNYTVNGNNHKLTINSVFAFGGNDKEHSTVNMKDLNLEFNFDGVSGMALYSSYLTLENVKVTSKKTLKTAFNIMTGSTVTATNSTFKDMNLEGSSTDGLQTAVFLVVDGTLTLNNSEVSGNTGQAGGAVGVYSAGIFKMNGGVIKDNMAWSGAGVKVWHVNGQVAVEGGAVIYGNKLRNDGNPASNIELNSFRALDVTGIGSGAKIGVHSNTDGTLGKVTAIAEGTVIGTGVSLASTQSVISDAEDGAVAYVTSDGKLVMIKKPILTVTYDSGKYENAGATYGVVRAMSEFSNTTDNTVIESCGTYFVKTTPGAGAVPADGNKKVEVKNATVSDGNGIQMDCYEMQTDASVVAVSWYKLAGVDEYVYTIGAVAKVDTEKTVEYTEA